MYLSISIKQTDEGFVPQHVLQVPDKITVYQVGGPCSSYKEAYIIARAVAKNRKQGSNA